MGDPGPSGAAGRGHTGHPAAPQMASGGYPRVGNCVELLSAY